MNFRQCKNGHYYKEGLPACPYCNSGKPDGGNGTNKGNGGSPGGKTEFYTQFNEGSNKTRILNNLGGSFQAQDGRTVFPDGIYGGYRETRKLTGWLVTYSLDPMGIYCCIYEGRNTIGRDMDCGIIIPDRMVSGHHALILFRQNQFQIQDERSLHGTFINGRYINDELTEIHDNDLIKMGETVFKFKVAL